MLVVSILLNFIKIETTNMQFDYGVKLVIKLTYSNFMDIFLNVHTYRKSANKYIRVQCNIAKRGMKISDPIFPIEMDLAKRGINVETKREIFTVEMEYISIFSILEVGDWPKTFSHHLVMQHFEVYLHFYKFKLF